MNRTIAAASSSSRNRGVLLLAAVFGILSAMLMFAFLNSKGGDDGINEKLNSGEGAESVVVLTRNVNVGERITADMLATRTIPAAALIEGHLADSEAQGLVGQVAVAPLYKDEQVLSSKVSTYEGQNSLTWKVPGDRVDVMGITTFISTDPLTGEEKPDLIAGYLAQDVEVLAVAQTLVKTVPKVAEKKDANGVTIGGVSGTPGAQAVSPDQEITTYEESISITLALPPDLAAKVALVDALEDDAGQFRILSRQKGDSDPISGKVTFSYEDIFPKTR
jgi:pilus assembly protein CpaB